MPRLATNPKRVSYDEVAKAIFVPALIRKHVLVMPNGCWEWQGNRNDKGYGVKGYRCINYMAHRIVYTFMRGSIPEGYFIDHLCRNPPCCNPDHLEPVTPGENVLRGKTVVAANKKKTHCLRGHPLSGDNLAMKSGRRICVICRRAQCSKDGYARRARIRAVQPDNRLKLSDDDVAKIRARRLSGVPLKILSAEFGVGETHISRIALGKRRTEPRGSVV